METVRSFSSEAEAHLARSVLASSGIEASVNRFSRYRAIASGGYQLKVSERDYRRALAILEKCDKPVDMDEYVDADDTSYRRCPSCDSVNVAVAPLRSGQFLFALAGLGIPLIFIKRDWTCRKCGHGWVK